MIPVAELKVGDVIAGGLTITHIREYFIDHKGKLVQQFQVWMESNRMRESYFVYGAGATFEVKA